MTESSAEESEITDEIRWYQQNSTDLARADVADSSSWVNAPGTTTISVRMKHSDVQHLTAMAQAKGVPISHLVRGWILDHLHSSEQGGIGQALQDFDESYANLRRAITSVP